jgi:hypothetical protein
MYLGCLRRASIIITCPTWGFVRGIPKNQLGIWADLCCFIEAPPPISPQPYKWPVVPYFQVWKFSHKSKIPDAWKAYRRNERVERLGYLAESEHGKACCRHDTTCRVSNYTSGSEVAYLVPLTETEWFRSNNMISYRLNREGNRHCAMEDLGNLLLLRSDLHIAFDYHRAFYFFPKGDLGHPVIHTQKHLPGLTQIYHNMKTLSLVDCSPEYLYAHFAWAVFPIIKEFFSGQGPKLVVLVDANNGKKRVVKELSVDELRKVRDYADISSSRSPEREEEEVWFRWQPSNA